MKKISDFELEKISGGRTMLIHSVHPKEFDYKYEEALPCDLGDNVTLTWANSLDEIIPIPWSKNASLNWNGEVWTAVLAHCGWHQLEVIWKDSKGNYLVPTGIERWGM